MNQQVNQAEQPPPKRSGARGAPRASLDDLFTADEARRTQLLLNAQTLRTQQQEQAAEYFAEAARLAERLGDHCLVAGLSIQAFGYRFSAAQGWAQAGNFYRAIALCDDLLIRAELPEQLRERVRDYAQILRVRRAQWYREAALDPLTG
jgi:hypothetical protein